MSIISEAPYYDQYEKYKSENKNYTHLLAVPGRVAQSREFNEIQSTLKDIIRSLGDSILKDGNIIEGCQVIPDKAHHKVHVTKGKVYIKGMVLTLNDTTVAIPESARLGMSIVGVQLKESLVSSSQDETLKDPALGELNYNQPGCDRLKSELEVVVVNESEADNSIAVLTQLYDEELYLEQQGPSYSVLNETLARRTYDESGSYIVEGLNVRVEPNEADPDNTFYIVVESGKAYVHGYELTRPSSWRILMNRALQTRYIADANFSVRRPETDEYLITSGPYLAKIEVVTGSRLITSESVNITSNSNGKLSNPRAHEIARITKDGVVIGNLKYDLDQSTAQIIWYGTDYPGEVLVDYYYKYDFVPDKDYKAELYLGDDPNKYNNYYLKWLPGGDIPEIGTELYVDYTKYLARKDTVYLDDKGEISVLEGIPAEYGTEVSPDAPAYTLPLASIKSPPGGAVNLSNIDQHITVSNVGLTRFTMSDIHKLVNRMKTIEYDQTVLSLNIEAKESTNYDMRGIFTDAFLDFSKLGLDFNLDYDGSVRDPNKPFYNATLDLSSNMMYLPTISKFEDILYDATHEETNITTYESVATLEVNGDDSRVVLSQNKATGYFLIAPYVSHLQLPEVSISPSLDTWYDDHIIEVPESINTEKLVSTSSNMINMIDFDPSWHGANVYYTSTKSNTTYSAVGTNVERVIDESIVSENASTYLRSREILAEGYNYEPNARDIECFIDGIRVNLQPEDDSTSSSTIVGAIHANSNGSFKAKFTIPEGKILSGTRLVTFKTAIRGGGYENSASTFYQGIGTERTIKKTITTITTVLKHRTDTTTVTKTYYDPLAQTFVLDNMTLLSGVNIYFKKVPSGNVPVTCEIREVQDGDIKSTVYGFKTLTADEIRRNISLDGSKATTFRFRNPVLIEANREYALVLRSVSTEYEVFVAEIGEYTIGENGYPTTEMVLSNPYLQGVMMSSSNNSSWTVHQKTDVKFDLLSDNYSNESIVYFEEITDDNGFCKFNLSAESIVFNNTEIKWECSIDGRSYESIIPYTPKVLDYLAKNLRIRAKLSKSNSELSPILALDSVSVHTSRYDRSRDSYYVSKLISGLDEYSNVKIILDTYEPGSVNSTNEDNSDDTKLDVYVSSDDNNAIDYTLYKPTSISSRELSYGWYEKTYEFKLDAPATQCRLFVKFNSKKEYNTPAIRRLRSIMS